MNRCTHTHSHTLSRTHTHTHTHTHTKHTHTANSPQLNHKPHPTTVNFDPKVQDTKSKLTRDPTPYPKELHVKALQWRSAREEAASNAADKMATPTDVPLRNTLRSRSVHRPYSLIRAMSDPIEPGDLVATGNPRSSSRKRERSNERREGSKSPGHTPGVSMVTPTLREHSGSRGERPRSFSSSPSPPPLEVPTYHSPGHVRHQMPGEGEFVTLPEQPNGTRGGVPRYSTSPTLGNLPGDDLHTALIASNSNNNNNNNSNRIRMSRSPPPPISSSAVLPYMVSSKSSSHSHHVLKTTPTSAMPSSAACIQRNPRLQSIPPAQSEASSLSRSDTPNPRYSSSMESGFDADVEQDPATVYWYMTETSPDQQQQQQQQQQRVNYPVNLRRRHGSDSAAHDHAPYSAPRGPRRGSHDDYDHLDRRAVRGPAGRHRVSHSTSPLGFRPSHIPSSHHQKTSHSFDNSELTVRAMQYHSSPSPPPPPPPSLGPAVVATSTAKARVSFTAAAKAAKVIHARSRSDSDDLIQVEKATPTSHAHQSAKGSKSPCPLKPYYVNVDVCGEASRARYSPSPLVSSSSTVESTYQRLSGPGRGVGGADHTPHQRYPSSSDDSQPRRNGAEPAEQATPKNPPKVCNHTL